MIIPKLRHDEKLATDIVRQITGAMVEAADILGAPPGTVDATMTYSDGRQGVLEVTTLGESQEFQLGRLIQDRGSRLAAPGQWDWTIALATAKEFRRVQRVYQKVILVMESRRVTDIDQLLPSIVEADVDLRWLRDTAKSTFHGHPELRVQSPQREPRIWLTQQGGWAIWSSDSDEMSDALGPALAREPVIGHVQKLLRHDAQERHLFLIVGFTGLTPAAMGSLINPQATPRDEPDLPAGITHLWLSTGYGQRLVVWRRGRGWALEAYDLSAAEPA